MKHILKNPNKIKDNYHFFSIEDLVKFYICNIYPDKSIIVIYNASIEFERITKLYILKRDNFDAYQLGLKSDILLILFDNEKTTRDWVYELPFELENLKWEVYEKGIKILNNKSI